MAVPPTAATSNGKPADVPDKGTRLPLSVSPISALISAPISALSRYSSRDRSVTQLGSDIFEGRRCALRREARSSSETGSDETYSSVSRTAPMGMLFRQIDPSGGVTDDDFGRAPADIDGR